MNVYETNILQQADYYIENESTIRKTAAHFKVGKTTVHVNLTKRLKEIDYKKYKKVKKIIEKNKKYFKKCCRKQCKFKLFK